MATTKTEAQKVADLREQAMDKSLPQEVRDMADKKANEIEGRSVQKATGIKLAKGGSVAKDSAKAAPKKMMGGAVVAKAPAKELPMRGQRTATNMAKGGAVKKAKGK
jgi:hypothetical protein